MNNSGNGGIPSVPTDGQGLVLRPTEKRRLRWGSVVVVSLMITTIIGAGYLVYKRAQARSIVEKMKEVVVRNSSLTEEILRSMDSDSFVTVDQTDAIAQTALDKKKELIMELETINLNVQHDKRDMLVEFLTKELDYVRAYSAYSKKYTLFRMAQIAYSDFPYWEYGWESHPVLDSILATTRKASADLNDVAKSITDLYLAMVEAEKATSVEMASLKVPFETLFAEYMELNLAHMEDARTESEQYMHVTWWSSPKATEYYIDPP